MLLQLEETHSDDVNKLLKFAKDNDLKLSMVEESEDNYILPGKPLTHEQIISLIEKNRNSGIISMKHAHEIISSTYNAG